MATTIGGRGGSAVGAGGAVTGLLGAALLAACAGTPDDGALDDEAAEASSSELVAGLGPHQQPDGPLTDPILFTKGLLDFLRPIPGGNGRACGTCHVLQDQFALTPEHVEARWQALPRGRDGAPDTSYDPLFLPIDANDADGAGKDFTNLRKGLVRVVMKLPANVRIANDASATHVAVWRAVPTVDNTAFTARYQADGRIETLEEQARAAAADHHAVDRIPFGYGILDIAVWERGTFSSVYARRLNRAVTLGRDLPPFPRLDDVATRGKVAFEAKCGSCHGGPFLKAVAPAPAAAPAAPLFGEFVTGGVSELNAAGLETKTYVVVDGGQTTVRASADPGRMLVTGKADDFNRFDVPTLFGVSKTAPYFHDNSAKTLEDAVLHYRRFNALLRAGGTPEAFAPEITDDDVVTIAAFLRAI